MSGIREFFLNEGQEDQTVVQAPAFSITKVMAVIAPLMTAVVTVVTAQLKDVNFTSGQFVALIVSLIAFLAITGACDVIARGLATSAEKTANARGRWVRFDVPLVARLELPGADEDISILAASDADPTEFLCVRQDNSITWEPASQVKIT